VPPVLDHLPDLPSADRVHPVGRLVQEDQLRIVEDGLCDSGPLLHALGVGPDLVVHPAGQADLLEQFRDLPPAVVLRQTVQSAVVVHQAVGRMVLREPVVLGQVADPLADVGGAGRLPEQVGVPLPALDDAEEDLDESGLAGAVLAEQAEHLAGLDLQRHAPQCLDPLVALAEVPRLDHGHGSELRTGKWIEGRL
jgi:hypothetical protein